MIYRIGTVILHNKSEKELDIVDGQQRLISIALFLLVVNKDSLPVGAKIYYRENIQVYHKIMQKKITMNGVVCVILYQIVSCMN